MASGKVRACFDGGRSILVGTADRDRVPATCRGIAISTNDDCETVIVYVPVETGQETIANVASTRRIAIAASHPISHDSIQIKGTLRGVRIAREQESALLTQRMEELADVLESIGMPRQTTRSFAHWPAYAIEVQVEQVFDQTPGPNAGQAIA